MPAETRAVALWIDGRAAGRDVLDVFGMTLCERLLRAVAEAGIVPARILVATDGGAGELQLDRLRDIFGEGCPLAARPASAEIAAASPGETWLALDAQSLVDPRLLAHLALGPANTVAWGDEDDPAGAAILEGSALRALGSGPSLRAELRDLARSGSLAELDREALPKHLAKLRRDLTPYCIRVADRESRDRAERTLFWGNYKGSTDFFTKHVYPPMVWAMVRPLARHRVHPNWISAFNVVITVAAVPLFAAGQWLAGLVLAYTMSVLDSVDGKLARLTFRSSKLGHVLDHGLDVLHPPFWYAAWAYALDGGSTGAWFQLSLWLAAAYTLDRIVGEIFTRTIKRSIHAYAPIDVRMRTWISRRNINVPLFTVGLVLGLAEWAFAAIVAWQALTLLFHAVRLVQVWISRATEPSEHPPPVARS